MIMSSDGVLSHGEVLVGEDDVKGRGLLILVSGPSGVGKGTVLAKIKEMFPSILFPASYTTRERRVGEVDGDVYNFISTEEFEQKLKAGEFLEYALIHKLQYSGILKKPVFDALKVGGVVIREVDVQGFMNIKKVMNEENLVTVFFRAISVDSLIARIKGRSPISDDELAHRLLSAEHEMALRDLFDHQVLILDGKVQEAADAVATIIREEALKRGLSL